MMEQGSRPVGENAVTVQQGSTAEAARRLSKAMHDLCQPLTTLQCRLEMAGVAGTAEAYREAVELGLNECSRLIDAVEAMRGLVRAVVESAESTGA